MTTDPSSASISAQVRTERTRPPNVWGTDRLQTDRVASGGGAIPIYTPVVARSRPFAPWLTAQSEDLVPDARHCHRPSSSITANGMEFTIPRGHDPIGPSGPI